jgi:hypothetical protein
MIPACGGVRPLLPRLELTKPGEEVPRSRKLFAEGRSSC